MRTNTTFSGVESAKSGEHRDPDDDSYPTGVVGAGEIFGGLGLYQVALTSTHPGASQRLGFPIRS